MTTPVTTDTAGGVTTITLADEDNKNALGYELVEQTRAALAAANDSPGVRVVVLTNTGNTFCAGANLKERSSDQAKTSQSNGFEALLKELQTSPTPVVAKIAGHAMGGGVGLAAAIDISIASEEVKFGFTEVRLGVAPAMISVVCLPKMRRGEAMEAFLRGSRFPASHAAELGLINRAVPAADLDAEVDAVIGDIMRGGPSALATAKRLINEVPTMSQDDAFAMTTRLSGELFAGEEAAAGMKAFLDRAPAPWIPSWRDS